jgi:hypothetical protein
MPRSVAKPEIIECGQRHVVRIGPRFGLDRHNFPEVVASAGIGGHNFPEVVPIMG